MLRISSATNSSYMEQLTSASAVDQLTNHLFYTFKAITDRMIFTVFYCTVLFFRGNVLYLEILLTSMFTEETGQR